MGGNKPGTIRDRAEDKSQILQNFPARPRRFQVSLEAIGQVAKRWARGALGASKPFAPPAARVAAVFEAVEILPAPNMFIAQVRSSTSAAWSRYEAQCGAVTETEARCGAIASARPRFVAKAEFMDSIT